MLKRRNKKGFTLAELLIVVAIIAVLVAIAVPLFVSALNKAQDATDNANIRAVRGAAVVEILSHTPEKAPASGGTDAIYTLKETGTDTKTYSWELKGPWKATGTLDKSGNISEVVVVKASGAELAEEGGLAATAVNSCVATDTGYTVTVYLTITEVKSGTAS